MLNGVSIKFASVVTFFVLLYVVSIDKLLSTKILTRIMRVIVVAIAAQFLISGIKGP